MNRLTILGACLKSRLVGEGHWPRSAPVLGRAPPPNFQTGSQPFARRTFHRRDQFERKKVDGEVLITRRGSNERISGMQVSLSTD